MIGEHASEAYRDPGRQAGTAAVAGWVGGWVNGLPGAHAHLAALAAEAAHALLAPLGAHAALWCGVRWFGVGLVVCL